MALDPAQDPFAEGHEAMTPPELSAVRGEGEPADSPGWRVRVVPNLYPALSADAPEPPPQAQRDLYTATAATGSHEVIVNGPDSVRTLFELGAQQVAIAVESWRERMRAHREAAYVHLIVNEGRESGASLAHTHAQLFALGFVPEFVARERERFGAYAARNNGQDLLSDLVQAEVRNRERVISIDDESLLLSPYAAAVPYQLMIAPRSPRARFEDPGPSGAAMLHQALARLTALLGTCPPLNLWVRTAPRGADHYCWRIDIAPRLAHFGGMELGAGVAINVISPEQAAAELREAQ
jgi:UDPglucose--hexose-1-phosphate uridylyltransferase